MRLLTRVYGITQKLGNIGQTRSPPPPTLPPTHTRGTCIIIIIDSALINHAPKIAILLSSEFCPLLQHVCTTSPTRQPLLRKKRAGQKGRSKVSGYNAIIGHSGVSKMKINCHFCTVCTPTTHNYISRMLCDHTSVT